MKQFIDTFFNKICVNNAVDIFTNENTNLICNILQNVIRCHRMGPEGSMDVCRNVNGCVTNNIKDFIEGV